MRPRFKTAGLLLAAAGLTAATTLPASARASTGPAGYYQIFVQTDPFSFGMCLQPADPAGGAGTAIVQQPCDFTQAQNWAPLTISGTSYRFLNQASGLCMDVAGGAASGTPVDQWPCNSISNERWSWPHGFPDLFWPVRSQVAGSSSYCLDVPGASTQAGLGVQIYWCNNTRAQAWAILGPVS
jgi:ricin-type beta-trefoil lectin protein